MLVKLVTLHRALESNQLIPFFQPLVELRTGNLIGFEVLARWHHPKLGATLPHNFISMAERSGLIRALMHQVFGKAFRAAAALPQPPNLAVNVSATQLNDYDLPKDIRRMAEEAHFPLHKLTVEITESALLRNLQRAKQIMGELKAMGCKLSLDDFGTGYSSLSHLQALPFDELKIDRSFIASMTTTRESRKIVATIIGLGHSFGLTTVGEGVEIAEQGEMLLRLGCKLGQGWLYGRPVSADAIRDVIAAGPCLSSVIVPIDGNGGANISSLEALPMQRLSQLQAIYDGAPVGLCFLDTHLRYVSLNQRLADMNGISVHRHLGHEVREILGLTFAIYEPFLRRALQGEAIQGVKITQRGLNQKGPERTTLSSYQPVLDEGNEIIGISIAVVDITGLRQFSDKAGQAYELMMPATVKRRIPATSVA